LNYCKYNLDKVGHPVVSFGITASTLLVAAGASLSAGTIVGPTVGGAILACGGGTMMLGVLGLPVDAVITFGAKVFDHDGIAARKFSDLVNGKTNKASKDVFRLLIKKISSL
jgi:hypothetical protein